MKSKALILLWTGALVAGLAAGVHADAATDDKPISQYTHVHIGGGLAYPPHVFTHEVWYQNIVYDQASNDPQYTSLDIYVNEPVEKGSPVMIWVHGGAMMMGDKAASKDLASKPEYFPNKLGYILVSVNYRLRPQWKYPVQEQDVANAIAWVHDNIARFGGDPDQLYLMGHSAGAVLVADVATNEAFLKKAHQDLNILKGVIADDGHYGVINDDRDIKAVEMMYGPDWKKEVPVSHVKSGKGIPPFLLIHIAGGSNITPTSEQQAQGFAKALKAADVRATVVLLEHVEHFGANERVGVPGDVSTVSVEEFLASIPGKKRAPKWGAASLPFPPPGERPH